MKRTIAADLLVERIPETIKLVMERYDKAYHSQFDQYLDVIKSYLDFVALHSKLERDGYNPRINASY